MERSGSLKIVILIVAFLLSSHKSIAQSGPGGVGVADGTSADPKTSVWLKAEDLQLSDDDNVEAWNDASINNNNFLQSNSSLNPVYITNELNGFPVVRFNKTNNRIVSNPFENFPSEEISVVIVYKTADSGDGLISYAVSSNENEFTLLNNASLETFIKGDSYNSGVNFSSGSWQFMIHSWRSSDGSLRTFKNGDQVLLTNHKSGFVLENNGSFAIGGEQDGVNAGYESNQAFEGDIAEMIVLEGFLNEAQVQILNNYLSEKYDIPFSNASNDFFNLNNASYIHDLIGIGKTADGVNTRGGNEGLFLQIINGFDNGEYLMAAHNNAVNNTASINQTAEVVSSGAQAAWNRSWFIQKTGIFDAKIAFDFSDGLEDGLNPLSASDYVLLYRASTSDNYVQVPFLNKGLEKGDQIYFEVEETNIANGYYTIGSMNQTDSPVQGEAGNTWYSYKSGDWSDWQSWTLDPSGTQLINDKHYTPTTSPTAESDDVVVLSGKTITVQPGNDAKLNASLTVRGRLDFTTTKGHEFTKISGNGKIILHADNFPAGDATHFVTKGLGEGTVVFAGPNNITLTKSATFFNVNIILSNSSDVVTLLSNYTINGDLNIENGALQINDNSSTTKLTQNISGDLKISSGGRVTVGSANVIHNLYIKGDIINDGQLLFTNRTSPAYNSETTDGAVTVWADNDSEDQLFLCNNTSNFYKIKIDKGIDKTYVLTLKASDPAHFNLYGPANDSHGGTAQLSDNENALGLIRGTVRIAQNVDIPVLNTGGNYNISVNARLWVDGGTVTKSGGTAIVVYGTVHTSAGTVNALINSGFTLRGNGLIYTEGGTVNVKQVRTSVFGADHQGGFIQHGGTVNLLGDGTNTDYYVFNLTYPGNVFVMSGGTLNILESNSNGGFFVNSDDGNIQVSGGNVNFFIPDENEFVITSNAPFWNLKLENTAGNSRRFVLDDGINISSTNEDLPAQPLVVLNDFEIAENTHFKTNGKNVSIGRNFTINDGGVYDYDDNITTFNGAEDATLYIGDITTISNSDVGYTDPEGETPYSRWEHPFYGFTLNKPKDKTLTFASKDPASVGGGVFKTSSGGKNINNWRNNLVKVVGPFVLESGNLDVDLYSIRLYGNITNKGVLTTDYDPLNAQIKMRRNNVPTVRDIKTVDGARFGNLRFNSGEDIVRFSTDVVVNRLEYKHGRLDIGSNNLSVDFLDIALNGSEVSGNDFGVQDMIITNGLPTDGGVSIYVPSSGNDPDDGDDTFLIPIGTGLDYNNLTNYSDSKYTPAEITIENISDDGYITINPVDEILSSTELSGGDVMSYYWHLESEGFSAQPEVSYLFHYDDRDLDGTSDVNSFVPGFVLDEGSFQRNYENDVTKLDEADNTITFNDTGNGFVFIKANYTAGMPARFVGAPTIFYSRRANGRNTGFPGINWHSGNSWSLVSHTGPNAGDYPQEGDIAIIGYGDTDKNSYHSVEVEDNSDPVVIAKLVFDHYEGTYNGSNSIWNSRLTLRANTSFTASSIEGTGTVAMYVNTAETPMLDADMAAFNNNSDNRIHYYLDENGTIPLPTNLTDYPNLRIEGNTGGIGNRIALISTDIIVNYDLTIDGNGVVKTSDGVDGDITVYDDMQIGGFNSGGFEFNDLGAARTITVYDELRFDNEKFNYISVLNDNPASLEHIISVGGDIHLQDGSLDLNNTGNNGNNAILRIFNEYNADFYRTNADLPELYRIIMDKDTQADTMYITTDFNLTGPTDGDDKALEMYGGTLILDQTDIEFNLATGGRDFDIPSPSALELWKGIYHVSGDDVGIYLDGRLKISGALLDMDDNSGNGNNYIEYSASGHAELIIEDGSLNVGSQIRRGLSADFATLQYEQSGGSVVVGINAAPENNRGVFEILGDNSAFYHTGGDFFIARQQTNPSIAALYLDPHYDNLGSGTAIQIGHNLTPTGQNIGIYSNVEFNNLVINNDAGTNPQATLWQLPCTINENIDIQPGTVFDANGQDLILNGDFTNLGSFLANNNRTFWSGNGTQSVTGNTDFYNVTFNGSGVVSLNDPIIINKDFNFESSTLKDNSNEVVVMGYMNMDGVHEYGGTGNGIVLGGTEMQKLTGFGTFGKLSISNPQDVVVPLGNEFFINDVLRLEEGVFRVGRNLLTIGPDAIIEEGNPFSETNMIETNISFTDKGVKKIFNTSTNNFLYPIGANNKYTPVEFNISSNGNNTGSITIKAADEMHPTIVNDTEVPEIIDENNVLQYHWVVSAKGMNNFNGTALFKYNSEDVVFNSTHYSEEDYIPARLLEFAGGAWNKFTGNNVSAINHTIPFTFTSTDDDGISGDYTAGITNAIPTQVQQYASVQTGNWTDVNTWNPGISGGPRGAIVLIETGHQITADLDQILNYSTEIQGLVDLGTSFGHRFGIVTGTGTMYTETGYLPAGIYDDFFAEDGGILEFGGVNDYDVLAGITEVNEVVFLGEGERRLPNNHLTFNGDLIIDDPNVTIRNEFDQELFIRKDMVLNSGAFDAGTGSNASVIMNGDTQQNIQGDFTGNNGFNKLEIDNPAHIILDNTIEVNHTLNLTEGLLKTGTNRLLLNQNAVISPDGGTDNSYVDGILGKKMLTGESFTYPVGDENEQGIVRIENVSGFIGYEAIDVQYNFQDPNLAGLNTNDFDAPVQNVSLTEYWEIQGPTGARTDLRIDLDGSSDIANSSDLSDIRLAGWDGTKWVIVGNNHSASGSANNGYFSVSDIALDNSEYFTLVSVDPVAEATAQITSPDQTICSGESVSLTFVFSGTAPFSITYSNGTTSFTENGITSSVHTLSLNPLSDVIYTLSSISDANGAGVVLGGSTAITIRDASTPATGINILNDNTCQGTTKILSPVGGALGHGADWFWYDNAACSGTSLGIGNTLSVDPVSNTEYWVRAEGTCNETSAISNTIQVLDASIAPSVINKSADNVIAGTTVTLSFSDGSLGDNSKWYWFDADPSTSVPIDSGVTTTVNPAATTTYYLQAQGGCSPSSVVMTTVTVNPLPVKPTAPTGPTNVCSTDADTDYKTTSTSNASTYIWKISPVEAGTITGTGTTGSVNWNSDYEGLAEITVQGENVSGAGSVSDPLDVTVVKTPEENNITY